ncbi:hypothetical protein D0T87_15570 [Bacteroides sp. 51]|nr:hypothetical protein [Bacteroides sp. 51]
MDGFKYKMVMNDYNKYLRQRLIRTTLYFILFLCIPVLLDFILSFFNAVQGQEPFITKRMYYITIISTFVVIYFIVFLRFRIRKKSTPK